jgi:hypothetical protein
MYILVFPVVSFLLAFPPISYMWSGMMQPVQKGLKRKSRKTMDLRRGCWTHMDIVYAESK